MLRSDRSEVPPLRREYARWPELSYGALPGSVMTVTSGVEEFRSDKLCDSRNEQTIPDNNVGISPPDLLNIVCD